MSTTNDVLKQSFLKRISSFFLDMGQTFTYATLPTHPRHVDLVEYKEIIDGSLPTFIVRIIDHAIQYEYLPIAWKSVYVPSSDQTIIDVVADVEKASTLYEHRFPEGKGVYRKLYIYARHMYRTKKWIPKDDEKIMWTQKDSNIWTRHSNRIYNEYYNEWYATFDLYSNWE